MKPRLAWSRFTVLLGWFLVLIAAAIVLPCIDETWSVSAKFSFMALAATWVVLMITSLARYFYRSWRRVKIVENSIAFAVWLSVQTIAVLGLLVCFAWGFVSISTSDVKSFQRMRERVLQQDLFEMRSLINQYTIDNQKPPRSLDELVTAGYLRSIPVDPITGRNDTWVVIRYSQGKFEGGIVDVESRSTPNAKRSRCN